eukprot:CAMPEP_0203001440 /NCGR_PEP_ID=MMETSP1401-20130829/571_1 /ASSEMBLY_ACC=CAM_ASM_000894 /TAXON_ID=38833 /ORGANISM="Micromonas pusilla, Strain CCAC1681" /LENGTH=71 /DNA_ID=CAMNT_0049742913 /DNA_START=65 /DNA_END=276 /DNA_ORIENTATION=+
MTQCANEPTVSRELLRPIKRAGGHTTPFIKRSGHFPSRHPLERAAHDDAIALQLCRLPRPSVERRGQRAVL